MRPGRHGRPSLEYPPGPKSRIPGALELAFVRDPLSFLRNAATYGEIAHFKFRSTDIFVIADPEAVKKILTADHRCFVKGQSFQVSKRAVGEGLLTSEGDLHHRQRRLMQPHFSQKRLESYGASMVAHAESVAREWRVGETLDVHAEMSRLTLRIVAEALFSTDYERDADEILEALSYAISMLVRLTLPFAGVWERLPLPSSRRFRRSLARLDRAVYDIIETRRTSALERDDLLALLLRAQEENGISDKQVRDEVMTLLVAGHETMGNQLTWTWFLLSQHPDVEARLHDELESVLGERSPSVYDLTELVYTGLVVNESLRMYPPVWSIPRRALVDYEINGYVIPSGSLITLNQWVVHHDDRFFPEPFAFDPERWRPEERAERPKYSYFPFGAGPRLCIGADFAWMEARLVLATLAQRWRLRLAPGHRVEPSPQLTLRPKYGMRMLLEARGRGVARDGAHPGREAPAAT